MCPMQWHIYSPLPRPDREPARNESLRSSKESSETDSDNGSVYKPSSTGSEESQIQDDQNDVHNPLEEIKLIVFKSKLWNCLVSVGDVFDMLWIKFNIWLEQCKSHGPCSARFIGVASITQMTFSSHQSSILFPFVARVWDKHQRDGGVKRRPIWPWWKLQS